MSVTSQQFSFSWVVCREYLPVQRQANLFFNVEAFQKRRSFHSLCRFHWSLEWRMKEEKNILWKRVYFGFLSPKQRQKSQPGGLLSLIQGSGPEGELPKPAHSQALLQLHETGWRTLVQLRRPLKCGSTSMQVSEQLSFRVPQGRQSTSLPSPTRRQKMFWTLKTALCTRATFPSKVICLWRRTSSAPGMSHLLGFSGDFYFKASSP